MLRPPARALPSFSQVLYFFEFVALSLACYGCRDGPGLFLATGIGSITVLCRM